MPKRREWKLYSMRCPKTLLYYNARGEEEAKIDQVNSTFIYSKDATDLIEV